MEILQKQKHELGPTGIQKETAETADGHKYERYYINGASHAFGIEKELHAEVSERVGHVLPRNPLEISGLSNPETADEKEKALSALDLYSEALVGLGEERIKNPSSELASTDIDALLVASNAGNPEALATLEDYAEKGRNKIEEFQFKKQKEHESRKEFVSKVVESGRSKVKKMGTEEIVVVHATRYKPEVQNGKVILKSTEDVEEKSGRASIHFTLNHRVAPNVFGSWEDAKYTVLAKLSDVLKANPDALESLYAIDTFFVPEVGEPLVLPEA
ncbi:MAG: hypothetical protein WDZ81_01060, partial [Candidatus Saccharimonadales bacterium]